MNIETAKRLYEYRKAHGYSQEELAAKIGVSRQAISKWERSESSPDTDNLIALAQLYGVSLDTLLMGEEEPQKESDITESGTADPHTESESGTDSGKEPETAESQATETENHEPQAETEPAAQPAQTENAYAYANSAPNEQNNSYGTAATYYPPAKKKKLGTGAKVAIIAGVAAVLIIIAAAIGINAYDEIREDRLEMQRGETITQNAETTTMGNGAAGSSSSQTAYTVDPATVNKISVEWAAGSVNIAYYDGSNITFDDGLDSADSNALFTRTEGTELKIYFNQNTGNTHNSNGKDLQIQIPKDMTFPEIDIECASAQINVNGIIADKIELHSISGEINATGEFASLDVETTSGTAQVTNTAALIRQIDANTVSGNITVTIPQSIDGFYLEYETVSGEVNTDFNTQSSGSSRRGILNYGNNSTKIEAETVSGDFSLRAAQ